MAQLLGVVSKDKVLLHHKPPLRLIPMVEPCHNPSPRVRSYQGPPPLNKAVYVQIKESQKRPLGLRLVPLNPQVPWTEAPLAPRSYAQRHHNLQGRPCPKAI